MTAATWASVHVGDSVRGADQRPWTVVAADFPAPMVLSGQHGRFTLADAAGRQLSVMRPLTGPCELIESHHEQPMEEKPTMTRARRPGGVLAEIVDERARQDAKWGEQNHPNGTGPTWPVMGAGALFSGHAAEIVRLKTQAAAHHGTLTWHEVLAEEFHEAMAESDPAALRGELVQVAAVAVAWIEAIDRGEQPS